MRLVGAAAAGLLVIAGVAVACTNFIVTPGASTSNSSIISYAADSAALFGALYHRAHATHESGTMLDIHDWDTGKYLGQIEEAAETYNTVGNTNEYGLAIGETTYGGLAALETQSKGIMDYGSLIYVTLQRAKTAREAITVMTDLVAKYGYASSGESFTIADNREVWVLEMIGKGEYELGAVWVARRVPDGHVTAHANQARITTFPRNDPANCVYSADVVSFAKAHGFYPKDASDEAFSFSDVYAPLTFDGARLCEMRVWSFFRRVVGAKELDPYADYARGWNLTHRMPWSYAPSEKLTPERVMELMKDHLEGTPFDFRTPKPIGRDIGADHPQLKIAGGYDHNFVLNGSGLRRVASVTAADTGRRMDVLTDQPGVQIYSANFLKNPDLPLRGGRPQQARAAICLETQHFPDTPNKPQFPSCVLRPGEVYDTTTIYRFSTF